MKDQIEVGTYPIEVVSKKLDSAEYPELSKLIIEIFPIPNDLNLCLELVAHLQESINVFLTDKKLTCGHVEDIRNPEGKVH